MEFRVLQYFLAVAKEESITKAAESLHLSQPTLSRQLKDLEDDLGKTLLIRGSKKTTLTEEGMLLQKRAQEIVDLSRKAEAELRQTDDIIGGDVWIGGAETEGMRLIAKTAYSLKEDYPNIRLNLISGNAGDIIERLEKGLIDFGVAIGDVDPGKYESIRLPTTHVSGLLMRKDSPLASRFAIKPDDLLKIPIISPRNEGMRRRYAKWLGKDFESLNIVATFNLIYNAAFLVEEGVGYALCIDRLIAPAAESPLCFVPYDPPMEIGIDMAWKKQQVFSKASQKFLERLMLCYSY
jgi:DNA-binding transcriptional LysR family regulator